MFSTSCTLDELKNMISNAIEEFGDMPYILTGAYGATGDIEKIVLAEDGKGVYIQTDIFTG